MLICLSVHGKTQKIIRLSKKKSVSFFYEDLLVKSGKNSYYKICVIDSKVNFRTQKKYGLDTCKRPTSWVIYSLLQCKFTQSYLNWLELSEYRITVRPKNTVWIGVKHHALLYSSRTVLLTPYTKQNCSFFHCQNSWNYLFTFTWVKQLDSVKDVTPVQ